jgi:hypothetical protein
MQKAFKGEKRKKNSGEERVGSGKCQMREKGTGSPSDVIAQCPYFMFLYGLGYSSISNSHSSFEKSTKNKIE